MKKVFISILMLLPMACMAQYVSPYYPYNSYQEQQQAIQDAYNYGRRLREEAIAKEKKALMSNPIKLMARIIECIVEGGCYEQFGERSLMDPDSYKHAYEYTEHLAYKLDNADGYLMLGYLKEMGIGTSINRAGAERCYQIGANKGHKQCQIELERIREGKYYTEKDAYNFKLHHAEMYNLIHQQ